MRRSTCDAYSRSRKPEAEALQKTSWSIGNITSWQNPVMTATRDVIMRTIAGRKQVANIQAQFAEAAQISTTAGDAS